MRIVFTILFILLHDNLAAGEHHHHHHHQQQQPLINGEDRMGDRRCSPEDIEVYQGATAPLPNGIPTYTVEVLNVCVSGCAVANIHVRCGWFSSARLINPRVFRRVQYDDCLVNDGAPLAAGESLSFQYANTFRYPLHVFSVSCF